MGVMDDVSAAVEKPIRRPWLITVVGGVVICGLLVLPWLAARGMDHQIAPWMRWVGPFHPLVLHLPIGVWVLVMLQELGGLIRRNDRAGASLFSMWFAAATAVMAAMAGFLLVVANADEYGRNAMVGRHMWGGLVFAGLAVATVVVKIWVIRRALKRRWFWLAMVGCLATMGFASHDGGSITHGADYLTRNAPDSLKKWLGGGGVKNPFDSSSDPIVYADIVAPIFERRCVGCHQESKAKGKLRMDRYDLLVNGGLSGPAMVAGDVAKSLLVTRIELSDEEEEHMPPAGKPQINADELAVIKWWIKQGGDANKRLSAWAPPAEIRAAVARLVVHDGDKPAASPHGEAPVATDPLTSATEGLMKKFPGVITTESLDSKGLVFSVASIKGSLDDAGFREFAPIYPILASVDLSASSITDASVVALVGAPQLRQLRLAETAVTDAAMDAMVKLPALESLNLYGTKVTDAGVMKLATLSKLKHLYLWQTAVTPETVATLKQKLPNCEILDGSPPKR